MVACLDGWREVIVGCDAAGLPDQVRAIEWGLWMLVADVRVVGGGVGWEGMIWVLG